ncbi:MAG: hypothetical protein JO112_03420, partial [Planctomycetes bacterium]|nr:hypothetical protein [Planctomycetota bacterium]
LHLIAFEDPRPPRSVDRSIPVELETIVLKALAKSPGDRYATAQELADDLGRFLDDQPVRARRATLLDRAMKWSRRHRSVVVSGLILLVLATVSLLVTTLLVARANQQVNVAYELEHQKAAEAQKESEEAQQQRARAEANFLEARRAVDFLTQISSEELVDKPEALEVRQKLLEGALQYYQEFIQQHQDDPTIQKDLAASRDQVAQILRDLSAQQDYFRLMLLTLLLEEQAVREELHITPAQEEKITNLSDQFREERHLAFQVLCKLPEKERLGKFKEMASADEEAITTILTPAQVKRLKQIALQERGPRALLETEVIRALNLRADQKTRIRGIVEDAQREVNEIFKHGHHRRREEDQKVQQIWKEAQEKILAQLTPVQQAAWKKMTGEPFQGQMHFSPQVGFGPPGPGHPGPHGPPPGPRDGPPPPDEHRPGDGPPPRPPDDHGPEDR